MKAYNKKKKDIHSTKPKWKLEYDCAVLKCVVMKKKKVQDWFNHDLDKGQTINLMWNFSYSEKRIRKWEKINKKEC